MKNLEFTGEWVGEINNKLGIILGFKLKRIIKKLESRNYGIIVAETEPIGKILVFKEKEDYTMQSAQKFDFYDEMITHIPMMAHGNPKKVLIIGGGDGIVAREVLKYSVDIVDIIEIDELVIRVSKDYLKLDSGALTNPRVRINIGDASEFVKKIKSTYDIIIGDYSDPYNNMPAGTLITEYFYKEIYRILDKNGIAVFQAGSPLFQQEILKKIYRCATRVFPIVKLYWAPVLYYPGSIWTFIAATKGKDPTVPVGDPPQAIYYNKAIHKAAFLLPNIIKQLLEEAENES